MNLAEKYKTLLQAALLLALILASSFFWGYILFIDVQNNSDTWDWRFVLFQITIDISFIFSILIGVKLWKVNFTDSFRIPKVNTAILLFLLCLFSVVIFPIFYPYYFYSKFLAGKLDFFQFFIPSMETKSDMYLFVKGVVLAPIYEEIFYRKILFGKLREYFPAFIAIIISSSMFAIGHLEPDRFLEIFVAGVMYCIIYQKTKSLLAIIGCHSFNNLFNDFALPMEIDMVEHYGYTLVFALCLIGFVICLYKVSKLTAYETSE